MNLNHQDYSGSSMLGLTNEQQASLTAIYRLLQDISVIHGDGPSDH